jgi:hypothetical protein
LAASHARDHARELGIPPKDPRERHGANFTLVRAGATLQVDDVPPEMVVELFDG